ncbi:MAG: hypothetical protein RL637_644 [Pseudomonadota bacterium]|jgi:phenylalanyl-tRNA synthetase beta chain
MKLSEAWLRTLVNPKLSTTELVEQLTMAGLEVESVTAVAGEFSGVVVAEVLTVIPHPNADRLRVCEVKVANNEILQIVCGATNVRAGLKVPAALIGAVLPQDFKIKKSKLRGVESQGMLCSATELGLAEVADGLLELAADAPVGVNIRQYLQLDDHILEFNLTPNRADCLSVEGLAREIAALNGIVWQPLKTESTEITVSQSLPIIVANPEACPRYLGRVIQAVNPQAATPLWMMERLRRSGQRSLGILVDVTNYVLLELGQPLHAFDAAKLSGNIQVRYARVGESLALLNGQHIELTAETLVIADQQKPLALAGIMGGSESAVSETTTDIFLECAFFNPIIMAGKARQYGLHTDSSHRFERGVDFELQHRAIERATQLIVEIAGGLVAEINEFVDQKHLPKISPIQLRHSRINQVLGIEIADNIVIDILQNLGMQVLSESNIWTIIPPSARFDIKIEADLIEEIARIYGYNQLPQQLTITPNQLAQVQETQLTLDRIKDLLVDRGYQEIVSYSFVDPNLQQQLMPDFPAVALQNPISNEMAVMRTTLWSGLLSTALHNLHRQHSRMRLFETGLRFVQQDGQLQQQKRLAGLIIGSAMPEQWAEANRPVDFFDLKADVEAIFALSGSAVEYVSANHSALHPGQSAQLLNSQGELIGWVGLLHPTLERNLGFHQSVFLFELDQATLLTKPLPHFQPLSKFPSVRRDLAIIVEDKITANAIINSIYQSAEANLQQAFIFDVYQGKGITEGYKSIALALILQNNEQTLTDLQIDAIVTNFLNTLTRDTGAKLRD